MQVAATPRAIHEEYHHRPEDSEVAHVPQELEESSGCVWFKDVERSPRGARASCVRGPCDVVVAHLRGFGDVFGAFVQPVVLRADEMHPARKDRNFMEEAASCAQVYYVSAVHDI